MPEHRTAASRVSQPSVGIERSPTFSPRGLVPRQVTVYLPPGYNPKRARPYPLLLALDGQMMPQWKLGETLARLSEARQVDSPIVAAVPATPARIDEYGTADTLDFAGRGRLANSFQDFLTRDLLRWLRKNYPVASEARLTGIFGASLGGLSALDCAWRRPQLFGFAGIFSGSLWWRTENSSAGAQQASRIIHQKVRASRRNRALRLWFQAGTADESADRDLNGVIDAIQDTVELLEELRVKGFRRGKQLAYHQMEGGRHHESTWAEALPEFLRWALPKRALR